MNIREKTERLSFLRFVSRPICRKMMQAAIEFRDWVYYPGVLEMRV
jgi:hypothetical protein